MEKILLAGNQNRYFQTMYDSLAENYEIHICEYNNSTIRRNIKIVKPGMLVCVKPLTATADSIKDLVDEFEELKKIVILEENDETMMRYPGEKPICMYKPLRLMDLKAKIDRMIEHKEIVTKRFSILAVDDSSMVLRSIKQILEADYDVSFANSGAKALAALTKMEFDLVLLDYEMPEMNGYEVFRAMADLEKNVSTPVFFLTAVAEREKILEVLSYHPAGYLLKPIDGEVLKGKLQEILN